MGRPVPWKSVMMIFPSSMPLRTSYGEELPGPCTARLAPPKLLRVARWLEEATLRVVKRGGQAVATARRKKAIENHTNVHLRMLL
jgi:hypothetical protein